MSEETTTIELEPALQKIADKLDGLTLLQASQLVKSLEEKWGVSAAAPAAVAMAPDGGGTEEVEQTAFDVILQAAGAYLGGLIGATAATIGTAAGAVAGYLLDDEIVEGLAVVESEDDPVTPDALIAIAIVLVAVDIRVAGGVEPRCGDVLAVARRGDESIDDLLEGVG